MSNRRLLPPAIKGVKLQKGESKSFMHGQNLCLVWRDKISVYMASNACGNEMVTLPSKIPGKPDRKKPKVIEQYNQAMGGVDKADQMGIYYCFQRKSLKWWKNVFFWLIEISVVNSYILYKETTLTRPVTPCVSSSTHQGVGETTSLHVPDQVDVESETAWRDSSQGSISCHPVNAGTVQSAASGRVVVQGI